jgi:NAD(P)-dependent dehydrogenase (short-subunit alcohol dehydrogenase family)
MDRPRRVAIVTGAGSGIGAAAATRLAHGGAAVVLVGRRRERVEATRAEIVAEGGQAVIAVEDIADPASPRRIVDRALEGWGRVDVIVNNAAYIRNLTLAEITAAQFDLHFATNLRGPLLLIQAALPALKSSDAAAVVNISSSSASLSIPSQVMYASTKAGLEFSTRLLAAELAPFAIRVNCIAPGPTDTEIHLRWARDLATARSPSVTRSPCDGSQIRPRSHAGSTTSREPMNASSPGP